MSQLPESTESTDAKQAPEAALPVVVLKTKSDRRIKQGHYWVYSNDANKKFSVTGDLIQLEDGFTASDNEVQVWATASREVGDGTYLVYVEDVTDIDVQNFKLVLTGPGITDNKTYGPYDFKNDFDASTTEATNPQAIFFVQVQNNSIVRSDTISIGDNLSSTLLQWTGPLQNSVVE